MTTKMALENRAYQVTEDLEMSDRKNKISAVKCYAYEEALDLTGNIVFFITFYATIHI